MPAVKALVGTTIKDGRIQVKKGYKFIRLSESEVAVAKVKATAPKAEGDVSTRRFTVEVVGSYECRCRGLRGRCVADGTFEPGTGEMNFAACVSGARRCRRGCDLVIHYPAD